MKIKLSSTDMLQIAKAAKGGWLDTDRVEAFKSLIDGYNPPKEIKQDELEYYLDCLKKGFGYTPTCREGAESAMWDGLDDDLLNKWGKRIEKGTVYNMLVKYAFIGLIAIKALGGEFEDVTPDFGFIEQKPPKFG